MPRDSAPDATRSGLPVLLAGLLAAAAAAGVFRGNLAYFFAQDDFLGLARVRGLAPALASPWRWLSGQGYFALMRPFGLSSAVPYHAVSLIAHATCAVLLLVLLGRRFGAPAALAGTLLFATHPALYTALYSVSGIGEILSLLFSLAAIAVATGRGGARWLAPPLFALALISKESVVLLPLALAFSPGWLDGRPEPQAPRAAEAGPNRVLMAMGAVAVAYAAMFFMVDVFGVRSGLSRSAPYAVSPGTHVVANAASYLGWTANLPIFTMRSFEDAADPLVFPWAAGLTALWLAGLAWPRLRASGWLAGGATYALLLLPVLGLRNHTYHYYLYAPLAGASWCAAALFEATFARALPTRAWAAAAALGLALVANGALLVHKIETYPFVDPRLRAEPVVDRARIARRVTQGLREAALPNGTPLVFWSPSSMRFELRHHPGADVMSRETYWERNVRNALMDGLAVRLLFPQLGPVSFVHLYQGAPAGARVVLYDPDGGVRVDTPARVDSLVRARPPADRSPR